MVGSFVTMNAICRQGLQPERTNEMGAIALASMIHVVAVRLAPWRLWKGLLRQSMLRQWESLRIAELGLEEQGFGQMGVGTDSSLRIED